MAESKPWLAQFGESKAIPNCHGCNQAMRETVPNIFMCENIKCARFMSPITTTEWLQE